MYLPGTVVASWSFTQELAAPSPFYDKHSGKCPRKLALGVMDKDLGLVLLVKIICSSAH